MLVRLAALLADGDWHTGPQLAHELGVSRARISQQIQALRKVGLDVFAVNGRGYRLPEPLALLDAEAIYQQLAAEHAAMLNGLDVLPEVDSSNAWLLREQITGTHACFTEYQSAGRGRKRRPWASPFAANLYFSVAHAITTPRAPLGALSLAVGTALVERLQTLGATHIGLKWPNDIFAQGAKLAGILIEHRGEAGGQARVVVGVGLNVSMASAQASTVGQPWTRLSDCMSELPRRNILAGQMLDAVLGALRLFQSSGFQPFRRRWLHLDLTRDQAVSIDDGQYKRRGIARGIGDDGALRVEFEHGMESVYAGDVSLRVDV